MKVGIIGAGHIGTELYKRVQSRGWDVSFVLKRSGVYKDLSEKVGEIAEYRRYCKDADVVFLAIPTLDDGRTAFNYIASLLEMGVPVVTCEKGALSNYFPELESRLGMIGFSATVGGGTRLLSYARERSGAQIEEVHAVVNGTLNYIFDEVSSGRSLGEVVEETRVLGYAEPGARYPIDVINIESVLDVPKKATILFNMLNLAPSRIRAKDIAPHKISEDELRMLVRESRNRRYIVSITKADIGDNVIGGFRYEADGWIISAGFKYTGESPIYSRLAPSGVNNSILFYEGSDGLDGAYMLTGQGAGAGPTTSSMIIDALRLVKKS